MRDANAVKALRDLAQGWREVSRRNRRSKTRVLLDGDPGPNITAVQIEWAAREIERLLVIEDALRGLLPWSGRQTFENDPAWIAARAALGDESA